MSKKNNLQIKSKKNNKFLIFIRILMIFISIYLMLRISYAVNYDNLNYSNFTDVLYKRIINPFPFVLTYNHYSLSVLFFWLLISAFKLKENATPKADNQWKGIEQGSNNFYTKKEIEDFLEKKTDPIVPLFEFE